MLRTHLLSRDVVAAVCKSRAAAGVKMSSGTTCHANAAGCCHGAVPTVPASSFTWRAANSKISKVAKQVCHSTDETIL